MKVGMLLKNMINGLYKYTQKVFYNRFKKAGISWWDLRLIKNLPAKQFQTIQFLGRPFHFYYRDELLHSIDEIFVEEIYNQSLNDHPYIIDCGANIGLSVLYLKKKFPGSTIIAFEPDEINFDLLEKNVLSYNLDGIILKKEAVWVENTFLSFSDNGNQMSHIERSATTNSKTVKATRLKDYLQQKIDFLKIDIEGAEYSVLKDISSSLQSVANLFVEYHGTFNQNQELNEIFNIITRNGFKYYIKQAIDKHPTPFIPSFTLDYDVQLNIFCFR